MAKKIVRGITDIKNIEHQDFDTNNVNDLLSDGQHNYIHRKKGNTEEYHNLTNNLKTLQSDDTDLLTVTNYNNTTNSATLRPNHDSQKEQLLESTDNTIVITHGENGTDETTTVDVNFEKVLEMVAPTTTSYTHEYGLMKTFVKKVSDTEEEFSFLAQMDKGVNTVGFSGNTHDLRAFEYLIETYGASGTGTININGDAFRIENGTTIIFNGNNANYNPHVVTFKDIIPTSAINTN